MTIYTIEELEFDYSTEVRLRKLQGTNSCTSHEVVEKVVHRGLAYLDPSFGSLKHVMPWMNDHEIKKTWLRLVKDGRAKAVEDYIRDTDDSDPDLWDQITTEQFLNDDFENYYKILSQDADERDFGHLAYQNDSQEKDYSLNHPNPNPSHRTQLDEFIDSAGPFLIDDEEELPF